MITIYDAIIILSEAFPELSCKEVREAIERLHDKGIIKEDLPETR